MSLHRRAAKRDDSEPDIVDAFEDGGATVTRLSGEGIPDLLVGYRAKTRLVECKTGNAKLTEAQARFRDGWLGEPAYICRNEAQAKKLLRMWDEEARLTRIQFPPSDPIQDQADGLPVRPIEEE